MPLLLNAWTQKRSGRLEYWLFTVALVAALLGVFMGASRSWAGCHDPGDWQHFPYGANDIQGSARLDCAGSLRGLDRREQPAVAEIHNTQGCQHGGRSTCNQRQRIVR